MAVTAIPTASLEMTPGDIIPVTLRVVRRTACQTFMALSVPHSAYQVRITRFTTIAIQKRDRLSAILTGMVLTVPIIVPQGMIVVDIMNVIH